MSKPRNDLTADEVRSLLDYDPDTGVLTWKERPAFTPRDRAWNTRFAGRPAGNINNTNYRTVGIYGRAYLAHRLAWLLVTREWPAYQIDHINMQRDDNRFINLREASQSENMHNCTKQKNNTSGHKGVYWDTRRNKWQVQICAAHKRIFLGRFSSKEEASRAYANAAARYHREFSRTTAD